MHLNDVIMILFGEKEGDGEEVEKRRERGGREVR
jgi:hypothetical protein